MNHFEYGKGKYKVWADSIPAGHELVVFIGGGEKPHIGSVSISEKTGKAFSFSIPEHKDYIVSNDAACRISEATGRRCLVVVGIHIQNASKLEIKKLLENSGKCVDKLIEKIGT
ncbi:MAG: hypothetical protein LUQ46_01310 [Candidatus Methanomethyliaceae archaeon]|nr:hypothetical protein [Candidatus Methanomethyliaceae archaeon]MDD1766570.1 hypothetical protein [Candidatus Methanomethyliaceae archaeon]